ncbi:nuclease-related domain-containing protein [Nocardia sp. NPDC004278]
MTMLVINGDREMPGTEKRVVGWLQSHSANPAIAISGCYIPDRRGRRSEEADLVVITPQTCFVIEVKGILKRASGVLTCPINARWHLSDVDGDPVHVRAGDNNPMDQVTGRMYDLKALAEQAGGHDLFVAGLVLVIPQYRTTVTLNKGPMPVGRDVLLGDRPNELLAQLYRAARRSETPWTADLVLKLLAALDIRDDAVSYTKLLGLGFPSEHAPAAGQEQAPVAETSWDPPPPTIMSPPVTYADVDAGRTVIENRDLGRTDTYTADDLNDDYAVPFTASNSSGSRGRRTPVRSAVLAATVFAAIGCGLWYVTDSSNSDASDNSPSPSSVTEQSPAPEQAQAPELAPVTEAAPPPAAPAPAHGGFPFQQGC